MSVASKEWAVPGSPPEPYDVAVVGAGPAGLAAATTAADHGCATVLLDGAPRPGGQYWRHSPMTPDAATGPTTDRARFEQLLADLDRVDVRARHEVWSVQAERAGFVVRALVGVEEVAVRARVLVLAPGAHDRQLPFPGWDLPGVVAAGGLQALAKEHGVLPGRRVVVAGTGPFLLTVAGAVIARGGTVVALAEAGDGSGWLRDPAVLMRTPGRVRDAVAYAGVLARHAVPCFRRTGVVEAVGDDGGVTAAVLARLDGAGRPDPGSRRTVGCDVVATGWGFTPRLDLPLGLGCATRVDRDGSLVVDVTARQESSVGGCFVAGEATGVGGAELAVVEGRLAGLAAAIRLGNAPSAPRPARLLRRRRALRRFAALMHAAHSVPPGWPAWLDGGTTVCRCEEVTVTDVDEAVTDLGASDPRTVKLLTRCGMGWCQGRVCGEPLARLVAARTSTPYDPTSMATRPVAAPLTLGALATGPS
jgi:thioredoxin reductase